MDQNSSPNSFHDDEVETCVEALLWIFDPRTLRGWVAALSLLFGIGYFLGFSHDIRNQQQHTPRQEQTQAQEPAQREMATHDVFLH